MWLLDVNLPTALLGVLRSRGIDCDTAASRGWRDLTNSTGGGTPTNLRPTAGAARRAPVSVPQPLERCLRGLRREWVSFSTRALRTKLCMRTSFRTQNSFSRLAMSRGTRVASCTSSSPSR